MANAHEVAAMKRIGLLHHPKLPATQPLAENMAREVESQGLGAWIGSTWDEEAVRGEVANLDLLGIKMGRLGFLAELDPDQWPAALPRLLSGDYWIEERMMLYAEYHRGDQCWGYEALNDVVVSRGSLARIVRLETHIDGSSLTTYAADGLIVSTPTGSTAYAFAVGGPILPPQLKNILLIPIASHLSMDRAIVLSQGSVVKILVHTDHQAILTVDGQFEYELRDGDWVKVQASRNVGRFVRLQDQTYFYRTLMERLRWPVSSS
jgi:NAD+ kinase